MHRLRYFLTVPVVTALAGMPVASVAEQPPSDVSMRLSAYFGPNTLLLELADGGLALADFDGDGLLDAAVAGTYISGVALAFQGAGLTIWVPAGRWPVALAAADLDDDGDVDLAVADRDGGGVTILDNPGDGHLIATTFIPTGRGPHAVIARDLDNDGRPELLVANRWDDTVLVLADTGNGFRVKQTLAVPGEPNSLAVADLDGDGAPDAAVACAADDTMRILLNLGGTLALVGAFEAGPYPVGVDAGDLDGDGDVDLAVASREALQVSLLLNDGAAGFGAPRQIPLPTEAGAVAVGSIADIVVIDVNHDGLSDIHTARRLLRNTGGAQFSVVNLMPGIYYDRWREGTVYAKASLAPHLYPFLGTLSGFALSLKYQRGADTNADGTVDVLDLIAVLVAFGASRGMAGYDPYADLNANGIVDVFDVIEVVTHFGTTYHP